MKKNGKWILLSVFACLLMMLVLMPMQEARAGDGEYIFSDTQIDGYYTTYWVVCINYNENTRTIIGLDADNSSLYSQGNVIKS